MVMNATVLSANILAAMQANVKAQFPDAVATPFQPIMAKAIGTGVVESVQVAVGMGLPGQYNSTAPSIGIMGLDPALMISSAQDVMKQAFGGVGSATPLILSAIYTSIIAHMQLVTVTGVYGGPIVSITGMPASLVLSNIIKELPPDTAATIMSSVGGETFFKAIATGFASDMLANGKPTPIPVASSGPSGQTVAVFS